MLYELRLLLFNRLINRRDGTLAHGFSTGAFAQPRGALAGMDWDKNLAQDFGMERPFMRPRE